MPQLAAIDGIDRDDPALGHEDRLHLAVDRRHHGRGLGRAVGTLFPKDAPVGEAKGEIRLAAPAAGHKHAVGQNERRRGVVPVEISSAKFLDEVVFPEHFAGAGLERVEIHVAAEDKDAASGKHRRRARAVATVVALRAAVAALVIVGDAERSLPKRLAGLAIDGDGRLVRGAAGLRRDHRVSAAFAGDERTEPAAGGNFPELLRRAGGPRCGVLRGLAVRARAHDVRPIAGQRGGRAEDEGERGEKRAGKRAEEKSFHAEGETTG